MIFDGPDRMTRNDFDKMKIVELIHEHGKSIHFSRSNKVISKEMGSEDEFMFDIEVAVAKKMSKDISRKASMGMQEKANQGDFAGTAPLGYINNQQTKLIESDPDRSHYVKRAFELMATGNFSIQSLADRLYREGLRSKKGNVVRKSALALILNNPIYYGWFNWKGKCHKGNHEAIISKALYDRAQEITGARYNRSRVTKRNFPFSGVARCSVCNCTVLGELVKDKYIYYHCGLSNGRHKVAYIPAPQMPDLFAKSVQSISLDDERADWLLEVIEHTQKGETEYRKRRLAVLTREQTKLENRLSKLFDAMFDDDIDEQMLKRKQQDYQEQIENVTVEIDSLASGSADTAQYARKILELCKRLYDIYITVNDEKKAQLLRIIGSNFWLKGRTVSVTYNKPFNYLANLPGHIEKLPRLDSNQRPAD
ncbi:MAG: recombinase family protein [Candidatus Zixiibacteriota bacterium]